jgi:hypothetical protein
MFRYVHVRDLKVVKSVLNMSLHQVYVASCADVVRSLCIWVCVCVCVCECVCGVCVFVCVCVCACSMHECTHILNVFVSACARTWVCVREWVCWVCEVVVTSALCVDWCMLE